MSLNEKELEERLAKVEQVFKDTAEQSGVSLDESAVLGDRLGEWLDARVEQLIEKALDEKLKEKMASLSESLPDAISDYVDSCMEEVSTKLDEKQASLKESLADGIAEVLSESIETIAEKCGDKEGDCEEDDDEAEDDEKDAEKDDDDDEKPVKEGLDEKAYKILESIKEHLSFNEYQHVKELIAEQNFSNESEVQQFFENNVETEEDKPEPVVESFVEAYARLLKF